MAPCVLDQSGVIVHYNFYTRGAWRDVSSSAQRYGPTPSSLLTQMSSSDLDIFEDRAIHLSPWTGAILVRVKLLKFTFLFGSKAEKTWYCRCWWQIQVNQSILYLGSFEEEDKKFYMETLADEYFLNKQYDEALKVGLVYDNW